MDCGTEIRLFDPRRGHPDWTDVIRPTEYAVFVKHRATATPLAPDGTAYRSPDQVTCIVFHGLDDALHFCEAKVQALPQLRCEIYDAQGLTHPPLAVILHPESQSQEDSGPAWSRLRKWGAGALVLIALLLFWIGIRSSDSRDVAIFLAINCIFLALRFLYWDAGLKHKERKRLKRLEDHRKMERNA